MSNKIMTAVFADQTLKSTMKFVMVAIADNASDEKGREGICFPSIATLVEKCGLSKRAVINNIELLVEGGYLLKASRYRKSGGRSSNMYLVYPNINKLLLDDEFSAYFQVISAPDAQGLSADYAPIKTDTISAPDAQGLSADYAPIKTDTIGAPDAQGSRGLSAPDAQGVCAPDALAYIEPKDTNPKLIPLTPIVGREKNKPATSKKIPASVDEAKCYASEIQLSEEEAEKFYDHFCSNGWLVGSAKSPMQDWKASMRNWKRNANKFKTSPRQANNTKPQDDGYADFVAQTERWEALQNGSNHSNHNTIEGVWQ